MPSWFEETCKTITEIENPSMKLIVPNPFTIRTPRNEVVNEDR